jgi:hypothetical protein
MNIYLKIKKITIIFLVLLLIIFAIVRVFVGKNMTMKLFNTATISGNCIAFEDKTGDIYQLPFEIESTAFLNDTVLESNTPTKKLKINNKLFTTTINKPINYEGYSLYLQDVSNYVFTLKIVYDPFRILTGIILTLLLIVLAIATLYEFRKIPLYFNIPIVMIFLTSTVLLWLKMRHGNIMPALKSWYFPFHVGIYITAYICAIATWIITLLEQITKKKYRFCDIIYQNSLLLITIYLLAIGMMLGALWAKQCWGNFWTWDIKENCALITLVMFLLTCIVKQKAKSASSKNHLAFILLTLSILAMLFTWKGVDLLPDSITSLHRY